MDDWKGSRKKGRAELREERKARKHGRKKRSWGLDGKGKSEVKKGIERQRGMMRIAVIGEGEGRGEMKRRAIQEQSGTKEETQEEGSMQDDENSNDERGKRKGRNRERSNRGVKRK